MPISKHSFFFLPLFLLSASILLSLSAPTACAQDKTALITRLHSLENITVTFKRTTEYSPDLELATKMVGADRAAQAYNGTYHYDSSFHFLKDRAIYEDTLTEESRLAVVGKPFPGSLHSRYVYTPERCLVLSQAEQGMLGHISDIKGYRQSEDIQYDQALGLRPLWGTHWFTAPDIEAQTAKMEGDHLWVLTQTDDQGFTHKWIYDAQQGNALVSYTLAYKDKPPAWELTNSDFKQFGNLFLPQKVVVREISISENYRHVNETQTLQVTKILPNDPQNIPDQFDITFPNGTEITDNRTRRSFRLKTVDQTLSDEQLQNLTTPRPRVPPPPTAPQPLPDPPQTP